MEIKTDHYHFVVYSDVLFVEAFLTWNHKIAREGLHCFTDLVFNYYMNKKWAILADIRKCNLYIPEAEAVFDQITNGITMPPTHVAHVVTNSKKKRWTLDQPIRTGGDMLISFFSTKKDARAWLNSYGYRMIPPKD